MLSFKLETTLKRLDELIVTVEEIESNNFDIRTKVSKRVADWFELVYVRVASANCDKIADGAFENIRNGWFE